MRVAVIGGTGFIGCAVVRELLRREVQVTSIHGSETDPSKRIDGVDDRRIDITTSPDALAEALQGIDGVMVLTRPLERQIGHLIAAVEKTNVKKIVYASTFILYPDADGPSDETSPRQPLTAYEHAKVNEEDQLMAFATTGAAQVCIARIGNVYGDVKNRGVIHYVMQSALHGTPFRVNGDGGNVRDFIFVDDVAMLLTDLAIREQTVNLEVFNVCSGTGYTLRDVIRMAEEATGKTIAIEYGPAIQEKRSIIGDNRKILQATQSALRYDLAAGLRETWKRYTHNAAISV